MVRELGKSTYRGGLYLCPECGGVARPTILSPAELEVLRRYAGGQTTAEIAANRGRSLKTVETQIQEAKRKLGARTLAQAVRLGIQKGLVPLD